MKTTIDDVASLAGVSIKTVSRVMNNEPAVRTSTRAKVLAAVQTLNYSPNAAARSFASKHSFTVACLYDNPNAYYVTDLHRGLLNILRKANYELVIHPASPNENIDTMVHRLKTQIRVAGVILTSPFSENNALIEKLKASDISYVKILSSQESDDINPSSILVDDFSGAEQLTKHLIKDGHREIAFIQGDGNHFSTQQRFKGFEAALMDAGITIKPEFMVSTQYTFESGQNAALKLLDGSKRPTAILSGNDEMASGVLSACRQKGLKCPDEIAIAGFENSPFSRQSWPQLTTVHQDNVAIAELAAKRLLALVKNPKSEYEQLSYKPTVIIRESTKK